MNTTNNLPSHAIFHVRDRGQDKKAQWTEVGVAFTNRDGSLSLKFNCLPVDGACQLRKIDRETLNKSQDPPAAEPPPAKAKAA